MLGGILRDQNAIIQVLELLRPEDFYLESHKKLFHAMAELADRREPTDLITLSDLLKVKGEFEAVSGSANLAALAEHVPTPANIAHYARIVKQYSGRRELIRILRNGIEHAYTEDPLTIVSTLASNLLKLQNGRSQGSHTSELVTASLKEIEQAYYSKGRIVGVPTGLREFEGRYGGLSRGDLAVIGGRTSMGKTSFATTIGKNAAEKDYPLATKSATCRRPTHSPLNSSIGADGRSK